MKLIVGLGNIGKKYEDTRHNVGFLCINKLAELYKIEWKEEKKFFGLCGYGQIENEKTIFLKPTTYMNLSGKSIKTITHFYKIAINDIWIFYDDVDLTFGKIRFREKGSSAGHNGIKSIIHSLGTNQFPRIKIGIKNENKKNKDTSDFVLGRFLPEEKQKLPDIIQEAINVFKKNYFA